MVTIVDPTMVTIPNVTIFGGNMWQLSSQMVGFLLVTLQVLVWLYGADQLIRGGYPQVIQVMDDHLSYPRVMTNIAIANNIK